VSADLGVSHNLVDLNLNWSGNAAEAFQFTAKLGEKCVACVYWWRISCVTNGSFTCSHFSEVYTAVTRDSNVDVVIKKFKSIDESKLASHVQLLKRIKNPNVIQYFGSANVRSLSYGIMLGADRLYVCRWTPNFGL